MTIVQVYEDPFEERKRVGFHRVAEIYRYINGTPLPTDKPVTALEVWGFKPASDFYEFIRKNRSKLDRLDPELPLNSDPKLEEIILEKTEEEKAREKEKKKEEKQYTSFYNRHYEVIRLLLLEKVEAGEIFRLEDFEYHHNEEVQDWMVYATIANTAARLSQEKKLHLHMKKDWKAPFQPNYFLVTPCGVDPPEGV